MNLKQLIAFFLLPLILVSCAQIVPLSGGDKDIEAPKEVKSNPSNGSIFFTEKTITIEFDEFIKLNNISSQLIVSPIMETPPTILVKGKKFVIKLKDSLTENTTYSLNFGNAITDITENNVFPNYKYVFSTGSYIDSLSYSGTVVNAFDLSKKEGIYVLLYDQFEDSVPLKKLPRYVALTDKEGVFSITNIAHGEYKFFVINDINGNYLFDLPNEAIAFENENINLASSSVDNMVYLFEEENGIQFIDKAENKTYGKINILLNLPTQNLIATPLNQYFKAPWYIEEKSEHGDSLTLWLTTTEGIENLELELKDGDEVIDTVDIDIMTKKEFKDTSLQITTNISGSFDLNQFIVITAARPTTIQNLNNIVLLEDSNVVDFQLEKMGAVNRKFKINYPFKENTPYQLFIPPATFTDVFDLKNDSIIVGFRTKNESDYGNLFLKISPNFSEPYIIQLYKKDQLVQEDNLKGDTKIDYHYLLPGDYDLKLIIDKNGNNEWDTGIYLEGVQPEKVIFYEKEIKMRANWDNDIIWTINE